MTALALLLLALAPARVQVGADEFSFALSRLSISSGPAIVQLVNYGEDEHDLALRRSARGARTFRLGKVAPRRSADLEVRLAPGRYTLWCSLADHRARGMQATLLVRRR
jgi:plastocyanin